MKANKNRSLV